MTELLKKYLAAQEKSERLKILDEFPAQEESVPVSLSNDLLRMNMDTDEKIAVLANSSDRDPLILEHYLTSSFNSWPQSLATFALRTWSRKTSRLLWFRLLSIIKSQHLGQRLKYTILDLCPFMAGEQLLKGIIAGDGLSELSPAFHSLLLTRCLQWNVRDKRIDDIADKVLSGLTQDIWHTHKAMNGSLFWFRRYDPDKLHTLVNDHSIHEMWRDQIRIIGEYPMDHNKISAVTKSILQEKNGQKFWKHMYTDWPPLFSRSEFSEEMISLALVNIFKNVSSCPGSREDLWQYLAGAKKNVIEQAILHLKDPLDFARSVSILKGFLGEMFSEDIVSKSGDHLRQVKNPAEYLENLPLRLRLSLTDQSQPPPKGSQAERMQLVLAEELRSITAGYPLDMTYENYYSGSTFGNDDNPERIRFFDIAYRGKSPDKREKAGDNFWSLLAHNWHTPSVDDLNQLAILARQEPRIFHTCYIHTLARFQGQDEAALKLLDYIRTNRENELQEVIHALGGIDTARSSQELVACITRPNITIALQLDICELLKDKDLTSLQSELRSAIDDLNYKARQNEDVREVCEALSALLIADPSEEEPAPSGQEAPESSTTSEFLDESLNVRIPQYHDLSSEVRRALRTAQFFYLQVEGGHTTHAIDLSPVIDMQYKALELIFRETFEDPCFKIINHGVLQRKLDVIGYSRPIPKAMEEFENYIGSLPVINEIPYFSKFKLRKMLRAICQYRPGRRFTLDGIKAFSLFFLCFGRKKCQYGLTGIIPLNFSDDSALFHFCKILHVFQDFRNRAAHEGFRPEARNDMEGIWDHTAEIIRTVYHIRDPLNKI